jgi:hypothetical protein
MANAAGRLILAGLMLGANSSANAALEFSPFVDLSETYTNNVDPLSPGKEEEEYVSQISPGFNISQENRVSKLLLNYRWQGLYYSEDPDRNSSYQQAQADLEANIINDLLFFEGTHLYRQVITNPALGVSTGNLSIVADRQDVATTRASPYLKKTFGRSLETEVRYVYDEVRYSDDSDLNSQGNRWSMILANPVDGGRWSWRALFSTYDVDYASETRGKESSDNASLVLNYAMSAKLGLLGTVGYENNKFEQASGLEKPESNYWNLGLNWTPTPRTQVGLSGGKRFFGNDWRVNISQRGRRSVITASYSKELSSRRQYLLGTVPDPNTNVPVNISIPYDEVYISKTAAMDLEYRTRKSVFSASASREIREYQQVILGFQGVVEEKVRIARVGWSWRLTRRSTFTIGLRGNDSKTGNQPAEKQVTGNLGISSQIGRYASTGLDIQRTKYEGISDNDYTENQATLRLGFSW